MNTNYRNMYCLNDPLLIRGPLICMSVEYVIYVILSYAICTNTKK